MEIEIVPISHTPDKFIIYRPRVGLAFIGNLAMARTARKLADGAAPQETASQEMLNFLHTVGFFMADPPVPPIGRVAFQPTTAVLLMTNQCQLRCTYCYAAAGEAPRQALSFELGRTAIDYVYHNAVEQHSPTFEVSFHGGGEPTHAWKVMQQCAAYARQKPIWAKLTLTSNGVWSERQREWIINNLDSLSLSLDGGPDTQDDQRPFISGHGSSPWVMRTVAALDRDHFPYGIRMTATAPWERLVENVRFLCENTGCNSIQVEPAFNTKRGGHGEAPDDQGQGFTHAFLEAFELAQRAGRHLYYSGARPGMITTMFCTAPYNALIVNGDGNLVTCYEVASDAHDLARLSNIGFIENGQVRINEAARDHLHGLMAERRDSCRDCFCYWSCAGDCYARAFKNEIGGHQNRSVRCNMNQAITEQLLLRLIANHGGVWRNGASLSAPMSRMNPESGAPV